MSNTPHELAKEFPDHVERLRDLKQGNPYFARLAEDYHEINRAVHRVEEKIEPTDSLNEQALRKKRMALKDEIWAILSA